MKNVFATRLTDVDTTAKDEPGILRFEPNGKIYRYVRAEDANLAVGDVVTLADNTGWEVTPDISGGASVGAKVAGVAISVIVDASYGWIQVSGLCSDVTTDTAVSKGDFLVAHTVDGECDTMADGEEEAVFGMALADDASDSVVAEISCL